MTIGIIKNPHGRIPTGIPEIQIGTKCVACQAIADARTT
jgi:hypothetical protein